MGKVALQFSSAEDLGSLAIRAYDEGPFSHVDIILPDGSLLGARSDVLGGIPSGVQVRPAGYYPFTKIKPISISVTDDVSANFYAYAMSQRGKPYDRFGLFSEFILHRNWRDDNAWWCSEIAGFAMETAKAFAWPIATPTNCLTPNGLFLACSVLTDVNAT